MSQQASVTGRAKDRGLSAAAFGPAAGIENILPRRAGRLIIGIGLAVGSMAMFLVILFLFWTGPQGSDDSLYWDAATGWLEHVPYLGTTHWALRHTLVIPLALARLLLGDGLPALVMPTLSAALALIAILVVWTWRAADGLAATIVAALLVTSPLLVMLSSTALIDPIEILLVFGAFALLGRSFENGPSWAALLAVGALAGLALMSRETTIFALSALGLLFIAGYGMKRLWYLVIGLGFLGIVGGEVAFYWTMSANPFYRIRISLHHDSTINRWLDQGSGTPIVHPLLDPVTMLLLSHYYGLTFWIGLPLAVWLLLSGKLSGAAKQLAVLVGILSLTWAVCAAGLWRLLPLTPRYYLPPVLGVSVLAGLAVAVLCRRGRVYLAFACGAFLLAGNLLGLAGENRNFMYGEHVLVELASGKGAVIHTDPQTFRRAALMLAWKGAINRVVTTPPEPGDLYFYNPTRAGADFRPGTGWTVVDQRQPAASWLQALARHLPLSLVVPPGLFQKLGPGHPGVTLYNVG